MRALHILPSLFAYGTVLGINTLQKYIFQNLSYRPCIFLKMLYLTLVVNKMCR
jgi:hypothetical protein